MDNRSERALLTDITRPLVVGWRWLAFALVAGALIGGIIVASTIAKTYESTAELLYRDVVSLQPGGRPDRSEHLAAIDDELELLQSERVLDAAEVALGSSLEVSVERPNEGAVVHVTAGANTPARAVDGATAIVEAYFTERRSVIERDFEAIAEVYADRLAEVDSLLASNRGTSNAAAQEIERLQAQRSQYQAAIDDQQIAAQLLAERRVVLRGPPSEPETAGGPSPLALASLGGLVGLVVAASALLALNQVVPRIHGRRDLALHLPDMLCLGRIPRDRTDAVALDPADRWAANLALTQNSDRVQSTLVLSGSEKDLPTSVAVAIARLLAQGGDEVALVDIAPTNPLIEVCGLEPEDVTLVDDAPANRKALEGALVPVDLAEGTSLLAVASKHNQRSREVITEAPVDRLVELLIKSRRHTIVVPAPLSDGGPPHELRQFDAVAIAAQVGQPVSAFAELYGLAQASGLDVIGVVLVDRPGPRWRQITGSAKP